MPSKYGMREGCRPPSRRGGGAGTPPASPSSPPVAGSAPVTTEAAASVVVSPSPWWERFQPLFDRELALARTHRLNVRIGPWTVDSDAKVTQERLIMSGRVRAKDARPGEPAQWVGDAFEFSYPPGYPFDKIDIRPVGPTQRGWRHQGANGDLCFIQEELEPWAIGYGIEQALEGARDFLRAAATGHFAHEVPAAELLAYLRRDTEHLRAVLLPPHAAWSDPPGRRGALTLEWDRQGEQPGLALFGEFAPATPAQHAEVRRANNRLWMALRLRFNRGKANEYTAVDGLWFALDAEPAPFKDFAGLAEVLSRNAGVSREVLDKLLDDKLTRQVRERGWFPIALSYPRRGRQDGRDVGPSREWLLINLEWPRLPDAHRRKGHLRASVYTPYLEVRGVPSHSVAPEDLSRRVGALYPNEPLAMARAVIVGVGALGSTVARSLAAAGVRQFVLVDPDLVKPGNVVRHEARLPDVGRAKVDAMAQILRETNPNVEVRTLYGTRAEREAFERVLLDPSARPTLVIATVALKAVDGQIDDVARRADTPLPVLHAWVMAEAQLLRAFVTIPGRTACVYCNGLFKRDQQTGAHDWGFVVDPEVEARPFFEASCVDPAFPGAGPANALAAQVITEMALDVLHGRLKDEESHWVFAGNRIRDIVPATSLTPLAVIRRGFTPHAECPVCSTSEIMSARDAAAGAVHSQVERLRGAS